MKKKTETSKSCWTERSMKLLHLPMAKISALKFYASITVEQFPASTEFSSAIADENYLRKRAVIYTEIFHFYGFYYISILGCK